MKIPSSVLLVEDNESDQLLARYAMKKRWPDTRLLVAADGQEALELLQAEAPAYPELILLDINMPRMNGHEFLAAWFDQGGMDIPTVVMLTSSIQQEDRERAMQYECVRHYAIKPLLPDGLEQIAQCLW